MRRATHRFVRGSTRLDSMGVRKMVNTAIFSHPMVGAAGSIRRQDRSTNAVYSRTGGIVSKTIHKLESTVTWTACVAANVQVDAKQPTCKRYARRRSFRRFLSCVINVALAMYACPGFEIGGVGY